MNSERLNIYHLDMNCVCLKPSFIREWLPRLASMGYNAILWEVEDKVQWETCPECVWPEAMTKAEFRELLRYSRSLGLEPIPLLQTIGHAEYVLIHEEYRRFREQDEYHDCYCTSNPEVVAFLCRWVEEYLDLFGDIHTFHIGGDEAYRFASCPTCSAAAASDGAVKLYNRHISAVAEPLFAKGIRPGIWNDMILRYPESVQHISKEFVLWDWNYHDTDQSPEGVRVHGKGFLKKEEISDELKAMMPEVLTETGELRAFYTALVAKRLGYDVILCSSSRSHPDNVYVPQLMHAGNIVGAASLVAQEELMGHCVTSWGVRVHDLLAQLPIIALAKRALTRPEEGVEPLLAEVCEELFGVDPAPFIEAMRILGEPLPFAMGGTTGICWNGLKDNLPAPSGYLRGHIERMQREQPDEGAKWPEILERRCADAPRAMGLLAQFALDARGGHEIIELWLTAAQYQLQRAVVARQMLKGEGLSDLTTIMKKQKEEYRVFLRRSYTPASAELTAARVFDALIDYCEEDVS